MGIAYKLCDCRFNDTREEENLVLSLILDVLSIEVLNLYFR